MDLQCFYTLFWHLYWSWKTIEFRIWHNFVQSTRTTYVEFGDECEKRYRAIIDFLRVEYGNDTCWLERVTMSEGRTVLKTSLKAVFDAVCCVCQVSVIGHWCHNPTIRFYFINKVSHSPNSFFFIQNSLILPLKSTYGNFWTQIFWFGSQVQIIQHGSSLPLFLSLSLSRLSSLSPLSSLSLSLFLSLVSLVFLSSLSLVSSSFFLSLINERH